MYEGLGGVVGVGSELVEHLRRQRVAHRLSSELLCQDIVEDEVAMRYEDDYRKILGKQTAFSFTKLRWSTGIQEFSQAVKSLGEVCAMVSNASRTVDMYRRGFRSLRERYGVLPVADEEAIAHGQLTAALTNVLHPPRSSNRRRPGQTASRSTVHSEATTA